MQEVQFIKVKSVSGCPLNFEIPHVMEGSGAYFITYLNYVSRGLVSHMLYYYFQILWSLQLMWNY